MTGDSLERTRIIVSRRLISPISCCGDINKKALLFRQSIAATSATGRLEPDLAVKALDMATGQSKPTYEDTDGKKREFTGDMRPGVNSNELGYRWESAKTWSPGDVLVLSPSYRSRYGMKNTPNFGWINSLENKPKSFDDVISKISSKPGIEVRKFKVNPKTDDIIPESERLIDPFSIASGLTAEERAKKRKKFFEENPEEKILPGRSLASRIPGGTLIARAAAAFGVLVDERNKFRCPPGTPAANQFTDAMGTNCFGFSASRFARFAARQAARVTNEGGYTGLRQNAKAFFGFLYTDTWSQDRRGVADPEFMGRVAYWDSISGDKFKPPAWRDVPVPENLRLFKNGAIRGQDDIARQKANVRDLYEALGIDAEDKNASVLAIRALKQMYMETGGEAGWDVEVFDGSTPDERLLSELEVRGFVEARLKTVTGWFGLSQAEQKRLIDSDVERYYETQRAMLETLLDQFKQDPSTTRFIGRIKWDFFSDDEASTAFYKDKKTVVPLLSPDGEPVLDDTGEPMRRVLGGDVRAQISINMGMIMANQETMLPDMGPDERLAISAVGARSEAEARTTVADFLTNTDYSARGMAGLLDGVYSFSSHIMLHESAHTVQGLAFMDIAEGEIADKGYIDVPVIDRSTGTIKGSKRVMSIEQLNGDDLMAIMTRLADGINLEAMDDAMERLKSVAPIAGAYPRDVFAEGSEEWALEVAAELYALRSRGIIYGDDIDAALEFMDRARDGRAAEDRARIAEEDARDADADAPEISSESPTSDVTDEEIDEALEEVHDRTVDRLREELAMFRAVFGELDEDEMLLESALAASRIDNAQKIISDMERMRPDPSMSEDEAEIINATRERSLRDARTMLAFFEAQLEHAKKEWKKKFGFGSRGDSKRFDDAVRAVREREGLISDEEIMEISRAAKISEIRDSASRATDKQLIRRIADEEIVLRSLEPGSVEARDKIEEIDALTEQFIENSKNRGDRRTSAQIRRALLKDVKAIVSPPPKKSKKFKDGKEARDHATKERRRLKATVEQKEALVSLGDIGASDIGQLLDPKAQTRAGRAINARNARLKRMGLEVDPKSPTEGDIVQQIENLLIPAMEAIDGSSIGEPFELETVIDFPRNSLRGAVEGREVAVDKFISGRVVAGKLEKLDIPAKGIKDKDTGATARRVIVQVKDGDRGVFPRAGEGDQRFVAPPGKIRIVGIDDDGTVRAEISYQKDAVEVIDSMAESIEVNDGDKLWRSGASKKIKAVADRYVVRRREEGRDPSTPRSDSDTSSDDATDELLDEVIDEAGGVFGEAPDDSGDIPTLSSGRTHFGKPETRKQRREKRQKRLSSSVRESKMALSSGYSDSGISRVDIDRSVAELLMSMPEEQIIQIAEESAYKFHSGLDRRVRVRARDEDIEALFQTGSIRSPFASGDETESGSSRRALRRAASSGRPYTRGLSSGAMTIDSPERLSERRKIEKQVAQEAVEIFNSVIDGGENINNMSDSRLNDVFGGKVVRSVQKSISSRDSNVYNVDDVPTAIALMMLGHHVAVRDQDLKLTAQAQDDFEKMVKDVAKSHTENNHVKWLEFRDKFQRENPELDINDDAVTKEAKRQYVEQYQADLCALYDPSKNLMCSGHIGIDREKMPQTNGRTVGHSTPAIRALMDGRAAGKFEPNSSLTPSRAVEAEFAEELDDAVRKTNAKRERDGKSPLDEQGVLGELYSIISKKHSLRDEMSKPALEHRDASWSSLSDNAKKWLYDNTNWQNTEVNLEAPFISFLNDVLAKSIIDPQNGPAVRRRSVDPSTYAPSQQQLVASKVNGMASQIQAAAVEAAKEVRDEFPNLSPEEFRARYMQKMQNQWFMSPILVTMDKYILDGHHRWGGINVANLSLPEELQVPLNVNEVQTDIVEGLTLGKVFQNAWGIKEARLGVEMPWVQGEITPISDDEVSGIGQNLRTNVGSLVDDIYASGDYIQLGSVGLSNNPDYEQIVKDRRAISLLVSGSRRPSAAAKERESRARRIVSAAGMRRGGETAGTAREVVGAAARFSSGRVAGQRPRADTGNEDIAELKTGGLAPEMFARDYFSTIGLPRETRTTTLPVSGYVVHKSHIDAKKNMVTQGMDGNINSGAVFEVGDEDVIGDGLTAYGDIEIVLKPSVSRRTAYGRGSSLAAGHRPVKLNSRNRDDVADALLSFDGMSSDRRSQDALIGSLSASIDGDYSRFNATRQSNGRFLKTNSPGKPGDAEREPFEALILGGFDIDEIEQINFPFSRLQEMATDEDISDVVNQRTIADRLRAAGFTEEEIEYFYSISGNKNINTESMAMLRNYRAAQKLKKSYAEKGLANVKIAHPSGMDIEDPRSHGKGPRTGQSVEDVLRVSIMREITSAAEKLMKETRSERKPRVVSEFGAKL